MQYYWNSLGRNLNFKVGKMRKAILNQLKINLSELENKATQALNSYDKCKKSIDDANATIKTIEEQLKDSKTMIWNSLFLKKQQVAGRKRKL